VLVYLSIIDILSSEILEDGSTLTKTSRTNQARGALLGGILSDSLKAVVDGLLDSTVLKNLVNIIELTMAVNNKFNSIYTINFLDIRTKKYSMIYK